MLSGQFLELANVLDLKPIEELVWDTTFNNKNLHVSCWGHTYGDVFVPEKMMFMVEGANYITLNYEGQNTVIAMPEGFYQGNVCIFHETEWHALQFTKNYTTQAPEMRAGSPRPVNDSYVYIVSGWLYDVSLDPNRGHERDWLQAEWLATADWQGSMRVSSGSSSGNAGTGSTEYKVTFVGNTSGTHYGLAGVSNWLRVRHALGMGQVSSGNAYLVYETYGTSVSESLKDLLYSVIDDNGTLTTFGTYVSRVGGSRTRGCKLCGVHVSQLAANTPWTPNSSLLSKGVYLYYCLGPDNQPISIGGGYDLVKE